MEGRRKVLTSLVGLALLLSSRMLANDPPEVSAVYKKNCSMCHKADGKGLTVMKTPDFTSKDWQKRHTDEELIEAISKGTGEGKIKMPAFGESSKKKLSPEQIKALVTEVIRKFAE